MIGYQWHQLDHMQITCTSLQTGNHTSTSTLSFFTGRMPFLSPNQQRQSTEGITTTNGKYTKNHTILYMALLKKCKNPVTAKVDKDH